MALPNNLPPDIRKLLVGTPWGEVFPARPNPTPLSYDGRTVALKTLKRYLSEITFLRPGGVSDLGVRAAPKPFKIASKDIQIGWSDYEDALNFPALIFLHGQGDYEMIGLTSYIEEETRDRFGLGTVVQWQSSYIETFKIEIWANKRAELRSILAGIETALTPTEQMYGLRFKMPDYFDQLVRFSPGKRQEFDEPDSAKNRRRAHLDIEMEFHVVSLVNYSSFRPEVKVVTDVDVDYNTDVEPEEVLPNKQSKSGPCDPCG